ncbi:MAG: hypothetical protein LBR66_02390 [Candidatus Symbiothrix sp.]|jgi:hypothetical protein|nr:hypothetical protein [Candidatus Symbiothrix sp.]
MIIEAFLIGVLFLFFWGWGCWTRRILSISTHSIALTVLLGMTFFGMVCNTLSFFTPLNLYIELAFMLFAAIGYLKNEHLQTLQKVFTDNLLTNFWFWGFTAIAVLTGSYFAFVPDQFGYYVPTLKWLQHFGLVAGTANIDWALGQMSLFHIIVSGLDQTLDVFLRLNIFIVAVYLVYVFERKTYLLLLFVPFYFLFIQSLSPDLPVALISLIIVNETCFRYGRHKFGALMLLSIFVFVIKPTAFWAPLFVTSVYLFRHKLIFTSRHHLPSLIACAVMLLLFVGKNILISGAPVYPSQFLHLPVWWQPAPEVLDYTNYVSLSKPFNLTYPVEQIAVMTVWERFVAWLTFDDVRAWINLGAILLCIAFGVFALVKKKTVYSVLWVVVTLKIIVTFLFSGQFRFLLDGLFPLIFVMLMPLRIASTVIRTVSLVLFVVASLLLSHPRSMAHWFPPTYTRWMIEGFTVHSLVRPETDVLETYRVAKVGNLTFNISTGYFFNLDTPPPAFNEAWLKLYYEWNIFPQLRNPSNIRRGIYMKHLSEDERQQLEEILKKL